MLFCEYALYKFGLCLLTYLLIDTNLVTIRIRIRILYLNFFRNTLVFIYIAYTYFFFCMFIMLIVGIMAVVTVGVAMGVVAGGVLLICAAKYLKR